MKIYKMSYKTSTGKLVTQWGSSKDALQVEVNREVKGNGGEKISQHPIEVQVEASRAGIIDILNQHTGL